MFNISKHTSSGGGGGGGGSGVILAFCRQPLAPPASMQPLYIYKSPVMCIKRCRHKESSGIHSFIHFRHWLYITMNWSLTLLFACCSPSFSPQASINFAPLVGAQIDLGSLAPVRPSVRPSQQREPVRRRHYMLTRILPPRCLSKAPICIDPARFWKLSLSCANGDVINCTRSIL